MTDVEPDLKNNNPYQPPQESKLELNVKAMLIGGLAGIVAPIGFLATNALLFCYSVNKLYGIKPGIYSMLEQAVRDGSNLSLPLALSGAVIGNGVANYFKSKFNQKL